MLVNYQKDVDEVKSFLEFAENWDGYSAVKINPKAVENAIKFLDILHSTNELVPDPFICPLPYGNVQIEWETKRSTRGLPDYFEFDFGGEECEYYLIYYTDPILSAETGGEPYEEVGTTEMSQIERFARFISERLDTR